MNALELAILFHHTYERLAPNVGYDTRVETRIFDPESPNGELMLAVCEMILPLLKAEPAPGLTDDEIIAEYCKIADGKEWAIGGLKDAMPFAHAVLKAQKEKT